MKTTRLQVDLTDALLGKVDESIDLDDDHVFALGRVMTKEELHHLTVVNELKNATNVPRTDHDRFVRSLEWLQEHQKNG